MKQYSTSETVDVVVIGTGAGGAPVTERLARAGLSVVALEAGKWRDPAHEFAADEVAAADLYWLGDRLSAGETPTAFGGNNSGTGVGGSTLHWGAFVPRAYPRDLRLATESGLAPEIDWPLTYADLLPYYEETERFIGVSGPAHYPWDPTRRYPLGPVPLNAPAQAMQRGFEALGLTTAEAPVATASRPYQQPGYPERRACVGCGYCHQGCVFGAKSSMDVTFIPSAVAAGAEIRPGCFVHTLERDASGLITAVVYSSGGENVRQPCRALYLCGGAVETPRLLLHNSLANGSGQLGRNFMAHVSTQVWGTFDELMRGHRGFPASLISESDATMRPENADFAGGYLVQSLGVVPVTFAQQVARGRGLWGQPLVDYLTRYNYVAGLGISGDCLPYDHNFLELAEETDEFGVPRARIHFSYGENEWALSRHSAHLMTAAWEAAGASDIWTFERSAHVIGTARMGNDPDTSVVDPWGRSHEIPNLWICDNSIFPSALAANPALTIMALALRSVEKFLIS
ncbi:GMC family oxidoreductase [Granulicella sp. WH15]|uniref:GMC family oxidoreductase n=1 Tax=Granulicella sp. WH15 TaxID=2602070 RepID=UPI00136693F5|nr:GMC family oxidoreductase [Granulicella sp. WH15]QHN02088.1 GMC family oxidoreductase [Granulicella sp. WH15]